MKTVLKNNIMLVIIIIIIYRYLRILLNSLTLHSGETALAKSDFRLILITDASSVDFVSQEIFSFFPTFNVTFVDAAKLAENLNFETLPMRRFFGKASAYFTIDLGDEYLVL